MNKLKRTIAFLSAITMLGTLTPNLPTSVIKEKSVMTADAAVGTAFTAVSDEGVEITYTILTDEEGNHTVQVGTGYGAMAAISRSVTEVTIPETVTYNETEYTVTSIGDYAFYDCSSLQSINIPDKVTSIEAYAFYYCSSLQSINIPDKVTSIGDFAFYYCSSLKKIYIRNTECLIDDDAFLLEVIIGYKGSTAQSYAENHGKVFIDIEVTENLTDEELEQLIKEEEERNATCGAEFSQKDVNNNNLTYRIISTHEAAVCDCNDNASSVIIPETVTYNGYEYTVTSIGGYAFYNCSSLTSITLPDSITSIGGSAFYYCSSLQSINIPDKVTSIEAYAFSNCSSLTSITLPDSITSIGGSAFYYCSSLQSINIPDKVPSIGAYAFYNTNGICILNPECTIYDNESTLPKVILGYKNSTAEAYAEKYDRTFVALEEREYTEEELNQIAEKHCRKAAYGESFSQKDINNTYVNYQIISDYEAEFYYCDYNASSVTIPDTVTYNGYEYKVTSIRNSAFSGHSNLANITLSENITHIGDNAFSDTPWLTAQRKKSSLVVVNGILIDGTTASGEIIIPKNVKEIADNAFSSNNNITSVEFMSDITRIGNNAFSYCYNLTDMEIPESVHEIGYSAFDGTPWLYKQMNENPMVIVNDVLVDARNCSEETITLPEDVKVIGGGAFREKNNLKKVVVPYDLTAIYDYAFYECPNFENFRIPSTVKEIGNYAFYNCMGLPNMYIPASVESIGNYAFNKVTDNIFIMNPDCLIFPDAATISATANIYGFKGSTAEAYAKKYGRNFIAIDKEYTQSEYEVLIEPSIRGAYIGNELKRKTVENVDVQYRLNSEYGAYVGNGINRSVAKAVTDVTIPKELKYYGYLYNVTGIADCGFFNCDSLENVHLPKTVEAIGESAFEKCPNLKAVYILNPDCVIADDKGTISNDGKTFTGTIYGYTGSTAEAYADKYGYKFISLLSNEEMGANLIGATLTLSGNIGINFYYTFNPEFDMQNTQVILTDADGNQTIGRISDYYNEEKQQYIFTIPVAAKDMSKSVSLQFVNGEILGETKQFSVNDYVDTIKENAEEGTIDDLNEEQTEALVELVDDMKAYGDYADSYFAEKNGTENEDEQRELIGNDKMQNVDTQTIENTIDDVKREVEIDNTSDDYDIDVEYYGSSLILESETTMRFYFKINNDTKAKGYLNNAKVEVNGKMYKLKSINKKGEKLFYIDIENITADMLQKTVTLKIAGITIKYSPMSFAHSIIEKYENDKANANPKLVELCKSLYLYNQSAINYADKNGGNN